MCSRNTLDLEAAALLPTPFESSICGGLNTAAGILAPPFSDLRPGEALEWPSSSEKRSALLISGEDAAITLGPKDIPQTSDPSWLHVVGIAIIVTVDTSLPRMLRHVIRTSVDIVGRAAHASMAANYIVAGCWSADGKMCRFLQGATTIDSSPMAAQEEGEEN